MTTTSKFGIVLPTITGQKGQTITDLAAALQSLDDLALSGEQALDMLEVAEPIAPATGRMALYFKADGKLYKKDHAGIEEEVGGSATLGYDVVTAIRPTASALDTALATEQAIRELIDAIRYHNHAWNSSFEFFLGTADCLGWTKIGTATIAQDTGIRDGYGGVNALKITSAGASNEGASQTLKTLKASTTYTVRIWMKATSGDTAKAWTTGAGTNLSMTSTSTAGEWKVGTFTTDATPTDVVLKLGSDTSTDIIWFDCLSVTEGTEVPSVYRKEREWDAPKQIKFAAGSGASVIATGVVSGSFIQATDAWEILGYVLAETTGTPVSTTCTVDVIMDTNANWSPTGTDSICASAKPALSASTKAESATLTGWTTAVPKGSWLGMEIESNNNGKCLDLFLLVRRR